MTGLGSLIYGTVTDQMVKGRVLFDFSEILRPLKRGAKVSRSRWNGKGMFIYYVPEGAYNPCTKAAEELVNREGKVEYKAYIAMNTVDGSVVPWVASQTDLLAEDWYIVE